MVKPIYLCSLQSKVGKTFLTVGIMQKILQQGKTVNYFKPIGIPKGAYTSKADHDVGFIQNSGLIKDKKLYDVVSPISIPDYNYIDIIDAQKKQEYLGKIKDAYEELSNNSDYVVIEGAPTIRKYIRVGLDDLSIAQNLGINEMVFIGKESSDKCVDDMFFTKKYFDFRNMNMKGVIFNQIDFDYLPRIKELEENHITRYNIPLIGVIERNIELISARVMEVQSAIGGELINAPATSSLENLVETYLIGAMNPQAAKKYLRSVKKVAFITGGDRSDLIIAALNENISCLILTGFIQPDVSIIAEANAKKIPILLSPSDTFTTMRNLNRLLPGLQEDEIAKVLELMDKTMKWDLLL